MRAARRLRARRTRSRGSVCALPLAELILERLERRFGPRHHEHAAHPRSRRGRRPVPAASAGAVQTRLQDVRHVRASVPAIRGRSTAWTRRAVFLGVLVAVVDQVQTPRPRRPRAARHAPVGTNDALAAHEHVLGAGFGPGTGRGQAGGGPRRAVARRGPWAPRIARGRGHPGMVVRARPGWPAPLRQRKVMARRPSGWTSG